MIKTKDSFPKTAFWNTNFIENFEAEYHEKIICIVAWDENEKTIIEQISYALENDAEIIISELLPDELPETLLNNEYMFFCERFVFIPPQFAKFNENKIIKEKKNLIVYDSKENYDVNKEFELFNSVVAKISSENNFTEYDISLHRNNITNIETEIFNSNITIINSLNPQIIHAVIILCTKYDKPFKITTRNRLGNSRLIGTGIDPNFDKYLSKLSIRSVINKMFFDETCNVEFINKEYAKSIYFDSSSNKTLEYTFEFTKILFNDIHKIALEEKFWIDPLFQNINQLRNDYRFLNSRFVRRFVHLFTNYFLSKTNNYNIDPLILYKPFLEEFLCNYDHSSRHLKEIDTFIVGYKPLVYLLLECGLNAYKLDSKKTDVLSSIAEVAFFNTKSGVFSDEDKKDLLRFSKEMLSEDLQRNRLSNNSPFKLHLKLLENYQENDNDIPEEIKNEFIKQKTSSNACRRILRILPSLYPLNAIIEFYSKFQLNDRCLSSFYEGILKKHNADYNLLLYSSNEDLAKLVDLIRGDYKNLKDNLGLPEDYNIIDARVEKHNLNDVKLSVFPRNQLFCLLLTEKKQIPLSSVNEIFSNDYLSRVMIHSLIVNNIIEMNIQSFEFEYKEKDVLDYLQSCTNLAELKFLFLSVFLIEKGIPNEILRLIQSRCTLFTSSVKFLKDYLQ